MFAATIGWTETINWIEIESNTKKDIGTFIEYLKSADILKKRMEDRDTSYRTNSNCYHTFIIPADDFTQYIINSIDDLGFTMEINGTHYIVGRVTIESKIYNHRTLTYLVALPQESVSKYYFTEIENFRY